jgi:hypothetical protein
VNVISGKIDMHRAVGVNSIMLQQHFFPVTFNGHVGSKAIIGDEDSSDAGQKMLFELRNKVLFDINDNQWRSNR